MRLTAYVFSILVIGLSTILSASAKHEPIPNTGPIFHVIVDPGHGGIDSGAVRGKVREADIVIKVGLALAKILADTPGYKVTLTRYADQSVDIGSRIKKATRSKADLFVSIHANSSIDPRARGAELYFQNQLPAEEESLFLANSENQVQSEADGGIEDTSNTSTLNSIMNDLTKTYQIQLSHQLARNLKLVLEQSAGSKKVVVHQGPFRVITNVPMPSLLVELGFLTNPTESRWLTDPETQKILAQSLFEGIQSIKEQMDKDHESSHSTAHAN